MPRSSRHKSSKHSSREAREYSDSEKDSSLKDRKGKEESGGGARVSKESGGSEKRKLIDSSKDAKDLYGSGNGDYSEEHGSSKRRRERADDGVSDRWNGGEDERNESKKSKESKESKDLKELKELKESKSSSRRREDVVGVYGENEEAKKSSGKHRDSGRKESRDGGVEREKKSKEGKSERLAVVDNEEPREAKKVVENTDLTAQDELQIPEPENQLERRMRKRRDGSGDGDKHQDDIGDSNERRFSSRDDIVKDGRQKDEKRKDERSKDKYREDMDRDNKQRDDKQREERPGKDHTNNRSDDKHTRDEKDAAEIRQKRTKPQDSDRERDRERDREPEAIRDRDRYHDRERDGDRGHDRSRDRDRDGDRDRDYDRDLDRDRDWDWDRDRERGRDRDRDRGRDREYERDREYDRDHDRRRDRDGSHFDDRSARYKDSRGKKRSPDDRDDCNDNRSRNVKAHYPETEKKSLSGGRVESDADRGRSQSRQAHVDSTVSSNKRRTSPTSSSHVGIDEYRHLNPEDMKYKDTEQRPKSIPSRELTGFSGVSERGAKYRTMEKPTKMDDGHLGEQSTERSSSSKASPKGLMERSPSSTSIDRRYLNRTGVKRSLDIEETGRRSSNSIDARDFSITEDRLCRDLPSEKPQLDESSQGDSSYYNRTSQSNASSLVPPPPAFRAGVDSPSFVGSLEEDVRVNSAARYKRGNDSNVGRGHGNAWRGVPNWSSAVPNGFIPFQHGPPHGGFQAMMPPFPSQPLFGVRPGVDINHSGISYHIPEADRFSGHLRPLGWQNMMDGSGPSHLHGWVRDEPHMYGGAEWDPKRHTMNGRGWDSNADMWKGQNGDMKRDLPSPSHKDDHPVQAAVDDVLAGQSGQMSNHEDNNHEDQAQTTEISSGVTSPAKEISDSLLRPANEKAVDPSKVSSDSVSHFSSVYLSKLDISAELARPEVFNECMSLLGIEQSATIVEDTTMHVLSEDGDRADLKYSNIFSSRSLFPAIKDSVFERAMDLYKKQQMEIRGLPLVIGGKLDVIFARNPEKVEEQLPICDVEKAEEPVPTLDAEMPNEPMLAVDQKKLDAVSTAAVEENMEPVSSPSQEVQNDACTPFLKMEVSDEANSNENPGEPLPVSSGEKKDGMTSELVKMEDADGDCFTSVDNESQMATTFPPEGENINGLLSKTNGNHSSAYFAEEKLSGNSMNGPIFCADGSSKVCEPLMPGSNESESVILSRIHHSPESTH